MDNFMYLGSCITAGGHIAEELSMRMSKARVAFCNLRHLWRRRDVSLIVKGRVCNAAVSPVLLYASETWPMVFGKRACRPIDQVINLNRLR